MFYSTLLCLLFAGLAGALPLSPSSLVKRFGQTLTAQWQCEGEDGAAYFMCLNLWGQATATSGYQTAQQTNATANNVAWTTSWNWTGGPGSVKSYSNVALQANLPVQLSAITSAWTNWQWQYTASNALVADVSYDIWFANSPVSPPSAAQSVPNVSTYEIMIWLGSSGLSPIGAPVATHYIAGATWTLWQGMNNNWTVFSFVRNGTDITNFSGNLNDFFTCLTGQHGVSTAQYLVAVQAGTEPVMGSATLQTNVFNVAVTS
ncbi:glycoside hydrolase family 12 protein [Athelia psychrophila]|uniref:Glycoside hydrolase family 12 protein n=1 Tax=Athelia psychrophila TaxID=1759441 RepID=A0A166GR06_9AGAM|nr:glycoside hydrolase family 12 protein [Fibularhizoctonia sp. CBS 109695]